MMNNEAQKLLDKYNNEICTPEEKAVVESWFLTWKDEGSVPAHQKIERVHKNIWDSLPVHKHHTKRSIRLWSFRSISVAAVILVMVSAGYFFGVKYMRSNTETDRLVDIKNNIVPGSNKAILTLAGGETINLSNAANGDIASQSGINITKTKDGQLIYTVKNPNLSRNVEGSNNTITTPKGGQWQVSLPDGTNVWLNSASSLKYPTVFAGNERKVELTGEAYFEVAKVNIKSQVSGAKAEQRLPFIVKTAKQEVEVLGTHFNINSYAEEKTTKTTLLEGSVRVTFTSRHPELVSGSRNKKESPSDLKSKAGILKQVQDDVVLKPGQQSILNANAINIISVDTEEAIAWKEGLFMFNDESLENILLNISRWYNVEIAYQDEKVKQLTFGLNITRYTNISKVLRMLELTKEVHFDVEGKKIIVMK